MKKKTCVIIPCYNVKNKILSVLKNKNLSKVDKIVIVDDCCPQKTGIFLRNKLKLLKKYKIIFNRTNQGVGGATITGFKYALKNKFDIVIKVDGDNQHDLSILKHITKKIIKDDFDLCKGYRDLSFKNFKKLNMPLLRFLGARSLTFLTKINSGDWKIKDVCHGLLGFDAVFLKKLKLNKIKKNYFFEQHIIINSIKLNAKVSQMQNNIHYDDESSGLNPILLILPFLYYHFLEFIKKN